MEWCKFSFEVILARQSSHFPTWASASWTFSIFTFCCVEDLGEGFGCVDFARLFLILDDGTCHIITVSGLEILHSQSMLDTSFVFNL